MFTFAAYDRISRRAAASRLPQVCSPVNFRRNPAFRERSYGPRSCLRHPCRRGSSVYPQKPLCLRCSNAIQHISSALPPASQSDGIGTANLHGWRPPSGYRELEVDHALYRVLDVLEATSPFRPDVRKARRQCRARSHSARSELQAGCRGCLRPCHADSSRPEASRRRRQVLPPLPAWRQHRPCHPKCRVHTWRLPFSTGTSGGVSQPSSREWVSM